HAHALEGLIKRLAPTRELHVHLSARTSVNGTSLRAVLDRADCKVSLYEYEPTEFAHSKLIGLTSGDDHGLLLCGSANLSQAALGRAYGLDGGTGNCEVMVARRGTTTQVAQ